MKTFFVMFYKVDLHVTFKKYLYWYILHHIFFLFKVKPLGVIWGKYEQWSAKNTIMFDDIRRNFIMNPQTGLRVCNGKVTILHKMGKSRSSVKDMK